MLCIPNKINYIHVLYLPLFYYTYRVGASAFITKALCGSRKIKLEQNCSILRPSKFELFLLIFEIFAKNNWGWRERTKEQRARFCFSFCLICHANATWRSGCFVFLFNETMSYPNKKASSNHFRYRVSFWKWRWFVHFALEFYTRRM